MVLHFNIWVAKHQQHSPTRSFLPASPLFLSTTGLQAGTISGKRKDLRQVRSMCMWFNESTQKRWSHISANSQKSRPKGLCLWYFQIALWRYHACSSWFWMPKVTPWVSGALVCITGASSYMTSAELDPNEAAQQLWRSNKTWWVRLALFSIPRCPFVKDFLRPNASMSSINCKWMTGDRKR